KVLHYLDHLDLGGTSKTCQLFLEYASSDFKAAVAYKADGDHTRIDEFNLAAKVCKGSLIPINKNLLLQEVIDQQGIEILHVYRSGFKQYPEPGLDVHVPHFVETNVFGFIDPNPRVSKTLFMSEWLMNYSMEVFKPYTLPRKRFDFINNPVDDPAT